MAAEDEEWKKAARAGGQRARRAFLRNAGIVASLLVLASALLATFYWVTVGSKKRSGESCADRAECGPSMSCFNYECTPSCESDARCEADRTCVTVPVAPVKDGRAGQTSAFPNLCVRKAEAPRYEQAYRDLFH